jgi:hypothetical protein
LIKKTMASVTRAEKNREIAVYVLGILEIAEDTVKVIVDDLKYNSVSKVEKWSVEAILRAVGKDEIASSDADQIRNFQNWIQKKRKKGEDLPSTIDQWNTVFTFEEFDSFMFVDATSSTGEVEETKRVPKAKLPANGVKLSDYPEFSGHMTDWFKYMLKHEATAGIAQVDPEILNITDLKKHLKRRADDPEYDDMVRYLYDVLKMKTSGGDALSKVVKYELTKDGALAWKEMKDYYNQGGDVSQYASTCMDKIMDLQMTYRSKGGMDKYISNFELLQGQLNEAKTPLAPLLAKTIFLKGIVDDDFKVAKDLSQSSDVSLMTAISNMKKKAITLEAEAKSSSSKQKFQSRNHQKKDKTKDDRNQNFVSTNTSSNGTSTQSKENIKGARLPTQVWETMTDDNKHLWNKLQKELKEKAGKPKGFGKQYSRKANLKNVVTEKPNDIIDLSISTDESVTDDRKPAAKPKNAKQAAKPSDKSSEKEPTNSKVKGALEKGMIWKVAGNSRKQNLKKTKKATVPKKVTGPATLPKAKWNTGPARLPNTKSTPRVSALDRIEDRMRRRTENQRKFRKLNSERIHWMHVNTAPFPHLKPKLLMAIIHGSDGEGMYSEKEARKLWTERELALAIIDVKQQNMNGFEWVRSYENIRTDQWDHPRRINMKRNQKHTRYGELKPNETVLEYDDLHLCDQDIETARKACSFYMDRCGVVKQRREDGCFEVDYSCDSKVYGEDDDDVYIVPIERAMELFPEELMISILKYQSWSYHFPTFAGVLRWANRRSDAKKAQALSEAEIEALSEDNDQAVSEANNEALSEDKDQKPAGKNLKIKTRHHVYTKKNEEDEDRYENAYIDTGSDTFGIGTKSWVIDSKTNRSVRISGYDQRQTVQEEVPIGTGITAVDIPSGETILLRANEATILGEDANTLFSTKQMEYSGILLDTRSRNQGGLQCFECESYVIPFTTVEAMLCVKIRKPTDHELNTCTVIDITSPEPWYPENINDAELTEQDYDDLVAEHDRRKLNMQRTLSKKDDQKGDKYEGHFLYPGKTVLEKTLQNTTQYGSINMRIPMRQHYKSRNPILQRRRINEPYSTDTWFSTTTSYEGYNCAQVFHGVTSKTTSHYGMARESQGPDALLDFFRNEGVPISMTRDNSKMQTGILWNEYMQRYWVKDDFTEPYRAHQNPAERAMNFQKEKVERLMIDTGCDPKSWYRAICHVADIHNNTANAKLNYRTPLEVRDGETPDISGLLEHKFWDKVYFQNPTHSFPEIGGNERLGRWLGRAQEYGDKMCYHILDIETEYIVVRSMVRSAEDTNRPNKGLDQQLDRDEEKDDKDLEAERDSDENTKDKGSCPIVTYYGNQNTQELAGSPTVKRRHEVPQIDPDDLIDLYIYDEYTNRKGGETKMRGKIQERVDETSYRVAFDNGKQRTYEYHDIIEMVNHDDEDGVERWTYEKILDHRSSPDKGRKGKIDVLIKWEGYEDPTWEPMEVIKCDDPVTLAKYAEERNLTGKSIWKWTHRYVKNKKKLNRMYRQAVMCKKKSFGIKFQFGIRIPRNTKEAYQLDLLNKDHLWAEAIDKEVKALYGEFNCFKLVEEGKDAPSDYQRIPLLWTFAVKYDGRRRARLVAGGHRTPDLEEDLYSGSVNLETVRILFLIAAHMELDVVAADVGNAYIQAYTSEKVYTIAGPEFGKLAGRKLIIVRALYGLKSSGAMWHLQLADNLRDMGYRPTKADYDCWIRENEDHYEYVAVIVDDLLVFSREPNTVIQPLKEIYGYTLKGVGIPEYYNGADIGYNETTKNWSMSAKTYIKNVTEKIEGLLELQLKCYGSPMMTDDHPELDESELLIGREVSIYQMLIGCAQWAITLGRFDIQFATNTMARYASMPRKGHMKQCIRIFGYLKHNAKGRIVFDPSDPNYDDIDFTMQHDWTDLYPDAMEAVPEEAPVSKNKKLLKLTAIVDASHASDLVTRRSVTGYILFIGITPIKWYSKRQNTVETSTYGSELVAMRIALEALLDMRYTLRMLGIGFEERSTILSDNQSIIVNTQLPTSNLKKKHNAVAYHKCREAVAAGIVRTGHINGVCNIADIETKPLGNADYYKYLHELLFGRNKSEITQDATHQGES